jgi:hypothetical protein
VKAHFLLRQHGIVEPLQGTGMNLRQIGGRRLFERVVIVDRD